METEWSVILTTDEAKVAIEALQMLRRNVEQSDLEWSHEQRELKKIDGALDALKEKREYEEWSNDE